MVQWYLQSTMGTPGWAFLVCLVHPGTSQALSTLPGERAFHAAMASSCDNPKSCGKIVRGTSGTDPVGNDTVTATDSVPVTSIPAHAGSLGRSSAKVGTSPEQPGRYRHWIESGSVEALRVPLTVRVAAGCSGETTDDAGSAAPGGGGGNVNVQSAA